METCSSAIVAHRHRTWGTSPTSRSAASISIRHGKRFNRYSRSMATVGTRMSVEEYLKYSGKPNCEYIDGELRPKPMPTSNHGLLEFLLAWLLRQQGMDARPEVTVRISPTRYLVPDVI